MIYTYINEFKMYLRATFMVENFNNRCQADFHEGRVSGVMIKLTVYKKNTTISILHNHVPTHFCFNIDSKQLRDSAIFAVIGEIIPMHAKHYYNQSTSCRSLFVAGMVLNQHPYSENTSIVSCLVTWKCLLVLDWVQCGHSEFYR